MQLAKLEMVCIIRRISEPKRDSKIKDELLFKKNRKA